MKKKLFIILGIVLTAALVSGLTYAAYTWGFQTTYRGTASCFDVVYTKGKDIGSNENSKVLMPGADFRSGLSTTVKVRIDEDCDIKGNGILYLNTDAATGDVLLSNSVLKYQVINGNSFVSDGIIQDYGKIIIYDDFEITHSETLLTVIVWLDGELITNENQEQILSSVYRGSISLDVENR